MSGWNSSRPSWDPQGGAGENTQAYSAPDSSAGIDDDWPEPGVSLAGLGYGERRQPDDLQAGRRPPRHRAGGLPQDARPAGPPPDIFQQDPGYPATAQRDYGQPGYGPPDLGQPGPAEHGYGREADAREPYGRESYGREAYGQGSYGAAQQDYEHQEDVRRDHAQRDDARRDYVGRDHQDLDTAARMDPALQDFFAPQPSRANAQPGSGQPGRPGGSGGSGQANPWDTPAAPPASRSASPAARSAPPGTRSARRAGQRSARRGRIIAGIAVGLVVALGIAAVVIVLRHHGKSGTPAATGTTAAPTAASRPPTTPSASTTATAGQPGAQPAGYTLATPATAGGYPRLAQVPAAVGSTATQTALSIFRKATHTSSGKLPSDVTAAYQLSGGQVMTFVGYHGSFNPATVIANLATLGANGQPYDPGPHGGKLACATAPGTPSGTVCVWVTTTTLGVTEFFSSVGPEVVTIQSKAATDTVRLREGVEVVKS